MKRVSIGVFAVVAILSACSSGDNENEEPDLGDIGAVTSASDIVLPLATYMFNAEEDTVALRAYNQLLRECGRRFGVEVTMPVGANPPPEIVLARRYGIIDATEASQDAYNLPPVPEKIDPDKDDVGAWNPSEVELLVVKGPEAGSANVPDDTQGNPLPDGGCGGEATAALGGFSEDFGLPDGLTGESYERAESDSRVKAAVDEWAACMDRAGYEYESIWEPNNADWPDPAGPEEIAVATADVACKAETNLAGIWLAVETAYQNQLIEENAEKLAELKAWRDNYLHNAAEALGAS